ncbi:MAG TPA: CpsB/CapC family capsule biosynthesis tyrosine phosphatase [Bryobacteraceae bacterium]|jgi:protein-tyrosine phosphatase|nr:CpsB/CapC family capsule biosynthesis tyrosine phosphatase [Bryobacteraceae bacterium]
MVDIHSHIVYGVDDGAKTIDDSIAMLEMAADCGTTDIVATPHSDLQFTYDYDLVTERIAEIQARMGDRIRIHRGCDFHLFFDNIENCRTDRSKFTINGHRYLMVEFADAQIPRTINNIFKDMIESDITPVITHPERNALLMKRVPDLVQWVRSGCLIQVTAQSFTGRFGKSADENARRLMRQNLVHFLASDAHDTEWRPPDMRVPYQIISDEYGEHVAERLFTTHPKMTLTGQYLECTDPEEEIVKAKPWWKVW